jgi:hypothetical protein
MPPTDSSRLHSEEFDNVFFRKKKNEGAMNSFILNRID